MSAAAACLVLSSACSGSILLGDGDGKNPGDAGTAGHSGSSGTGPVIIGGDVGPTADASSGTSSGSSSDSSVATNETDASDDVILPPLLGPGMGYASRDTFCGYTSVDPHNCGSCGHDCDGGACQGGACVPLPEGVLASGLVAPVSITVDATNVYWLSVAIYTPNGQGFTQIQQLLKCAKSGCNNHPTPLCSMGPWGTPPGGDTSDALNGIVSDGTNVYWASGGGVVSCAVDGSQQLATLIANASSVLGNTPWNIGVNATSVYSGGSDDVFSCPIGGCNGTDGGGPTSLWAGSTTAVAIDATNAYWISNNVLMSCALGGCNGTPSLLTSSPPADGLSVGQIALDKANVYWNVGVPTSFEAPNPQRGPGYTAGSKFGPSPSVAILKCANGGCNGKGTAVVAGLSAPMGLTTDGISVYFTDVGSGDLLNATNVGRVAKCPVAGCSDTGTTIADKLENPRGIAVDANNVYWADFGSGTVDANSWCTSGPNCNSSPLSVDGRIMVSPK